MFNFKNALLVAIFALFSLGLEAVAPLHTSSLQPQTAFASQGEGIVQVIQGLHGLRTQIIVTSTVNLTVLDSGGNIVYERSLNPNARRANINTNNYADGTYTLVAESEGETQEIIFSIGAAK